LFPLSALSDTVCLFVCYHILLLLSHLLYPFDLFISFCSLFY
jgi:hypothetical protein